MANFSLSFWEILLDVIGLCLCGITILYLVKNKLKSNQKFLKEKSTENYENFNEVLIQLIKQSEKAFETIADNIKRERLVLQELIGKEAREKAGPHSLVKAPGQVRRHFQKRNQKDLRSDDSVGDQYAEVEKLANLGLGSNEIFERVKIPKGEIELIINLKKKNHEFHRKSKAEAHAVF